MYSALSFSSPALKRFKPESKHLYIMPIYSHSRLSSYENCPLLYRYAYVDKVELPEPVESIEAFMGKKVHEALFKLYHDLIMGKPYSADGLVAVYDDLWEKEWHNGISTVRNTPEYYRESGRKCLRGYYEMHAPFSRGKTIDLEKRIYVNIDGYRLTGFADRISKTDDGRYEIHDYKTGAKLPDAASFETDRQLGLYHLGVKSAYKAEDIDLVWHYLVPGKEVRSKRSEEALTVLKTGVVSTIRQIEDAERKGDFPANKGPLCRWCQYRSLCSGIKTLNSFMD